jgi:F0F1-type ATP synthase assembly protein I
MARLFAVPKSMNWSQVVGWAFGLGYRIALPIVLFALGGRLIDRALHTAPVFLLIGIFSAMAVSFFLIRRLVKQIGSSTSEIRN